MFRTIHTVVNFIIRPQISYVFLKVQNEEDWSETENKNACIMHYSSLQVYCLSNSGSRGISCAAVFESTSKSIVYMLLCFSSTVWVFSCENYDRPLSSIGSHFGHWWFRNYHEIIVIMEAYKSTYHEWILQNMFRSLWSIICIRDIRRGIVVPRYTANRIGWPSCKYSPWRCGTVTGQLLRLHGDGTQRFG